MQSGHSKKLLSAAYVFADLVFGIVYAFLSAMIAFAGFGIIVAAFYYPPHYSALLVIAGVIVLFTGDWLIQNPPPPFICIWHRRTCRLNGE